MFRSMTEKTREAILCPQVIKDLVMKPSTGLIDSYSAAPGHEKYIEVVIDRCRKEDRAYCKTDANEFIREMGKIYFEMAIIGDHVDLSNKNPNPLRTSIQPMVSFQVQENRKTVTNLSVT